MADLLLCPFCGRPGAMCELEDEPGSPASFWVDCSCGIKTPERHTEQEAIALWNTRAAPSRPENVDPAMTPTAFVDDILSACDASNWDADRNTGDYYRGLKDAYEYVMYIAVEYQTAMYDATKRLAALTPQDGGVEPRSIDEYHEDMGPVLWWKFPIEEAPYCGTPNDLGKEVVIEMPTVGFCTAHVDRDFSPNAMPKKTISYPGATFFVGGWPGYHTHWTPLALPRAERSTVGEGE